MWTQFTARARRAVFFAQEEAAERGTNQVDPEHLLLGLVREADSAAARVLNAIGVSPGRVRAEMERMAGRRPDKGTVDKNSMQLSAAGKRAIDQAYQEARDMRVSYIGSEHLLLGVIRLGKGVAPEVLRRLGASLERARAEARLLSEETDNATRSPGAAIDAEEARQTLHPGDLGILKTSRSDDLIEVTRDIEAQALLDEAWRTRDHHAWRELVAAERVLQAPAGTPIKYLQTTEDAARLFVRVLEGPQEGVAGFIDRSCFHRLGSDERPFPPPPVQFVEKATAPPPSAPQTVEGLLLRAANGGGYVQIHRPLHIPSPVRLTAAQIATYNLRGGEAITGIVAPPVPPEQQWSITRITHINGAPAREPRFVEPPVGLQSDEGNTVDAASDKGSIEDLLVEAAALEEATTLHVSAGLPPIVQTGAGRLYPLPGHSLLDTVGIERLARPLLTEAQWADLMAGQAIPLVRSVGEIAFQIYLSYAQEQLVFVAWRSYEAPRGPDDAPAEAVQPPIDV